MGFPAGTLRIAAVPACGNRRVYLTLSCQAKR